LNWTAPVYNGGSVITGYKIYRSTAQAGVYTLIASPSGTTYIDTGRINGQMYWYNVSTANAAGEGAKSAIVSSTPYTMPNAPTGLTAIAGDAQVTLNWTAPVFNGGSPIDYYMIYQDGVALAAHPTLLTIVITGLDNGTSYSFAVVAHNVAGLGTQSGAITSTPYTMPNAPTGLTAIAGSTQVTLNWTAPVFNGGSIITGYNVYRSMTEVGVFTLIASPTGLNFTDTELTNGQTYWYNVSAVNVAGESVKTVIVSSMPCTVPNAPTGLIATAIYGQVTLVWTAPTSTGGSPITKYNVYRGLSDDVMVMIGDSDSATFVDTAATAGSTYHYRVSATNVAGEGAVSVSASVPVPLTVPITGKITDSNGNGLAGITVALENGTSVKTDANGNFTIFATPGNHTLTISGPGIETKTMSATVTISGLAIGKVTTTKATDYLPIILVLVVIAGLMSILFLVMRRRRKK
jgi:fibronectin type 3 domain-containing protein